jgi:4-amino-4-deoxy-L-arabinose transferase-like glycosyltransferase
MPRITIGRLSSPWFLACVLIAHVAIWTYLPSAYHANLQRDQIEGYAWGLEWQWGYAKHPPLWAWMLEALAKLTAGPTAIGAYALGAASGAIALVFVWLLARRLLTPIGAMLSVLLLEGVLYFNFRTVDFNANVVLLPFWAAAGLFLHRAVVDNRLRDWIGLGLALALGLYGKYATGILILILAAFLILEPTARRRLLDYRPWAGVAFGLLVLSPHLLWLIQHDLAPIDYALARTGDAGPSLTAHVTQPLIFLGKQGLELAGFLILSLILLLQREIGVQVDMTKPLSVMERRMVWVLAFGPILLTAVLCGVMGKPFVAAWGLPMFCFVGIAVVIGLEQTTPVALAGFLRALIFITIAIIAGFILYYDVVPHLRHRPSKTQFPGEALARAVDSAWAKAVPDHALHIIAGPIYVAGNAAFHLSQAPKLQRPHVLIDGDLRQSPWISPEILARDGAVLVWLDEGKGTPDLLQKFPQAEELTFVSLPFERAPDLTPVKLGIAILRPQAAP